MTEQASQVEYVPTEDIPGDADLPEEIIELLAFRLADEAYAVDLPKVKEIIRLAEITHVPRVPAIIKGISSLRGAIIPIFDLRTRFGLRESPSDRRTRIIVMMIEKGLLGFIADEVMEVVRMKANEIEPAPPMVGRPESEHLRGVCRVKERLVILLNIEKAVGLD